MPAIDEGEENLRRPFRRDGPGDEEKAKVAQEEGIMVAKLQGEVMEKTREEEAWNSGKTNKSNSREEEESLKR